MAFALNADSKPLVDMNVTPLVDVMLVLLIIFMITVPALTQRILIDLPQPAPRQAQVEPEPIALNIQPGGQLFWNGRPISQDMFELELALQSRKDPQPTLRIRADQNTEYQVLANVLGSARNLGMNKIGFVPSTDK